MVILKLIIESFYFAVNALIINKVRTFLSLLGITIGIFSIIAVFTVFDSLEHEIKSEINSLGSNVLFIQKWPWMMGGGNYPWWKYYQRPEPKVNEMAELKRRSNTVEAGAFMFSVSRTVSNIQKKNINSIDDVPIVAISHDYNKVMPFDLQEGRYFTAAEAHAGKNLAIIGAEIAEQLFQGQNAVGRKIKIFGKRIEVIGVIKKEGEDVFGNSNDNWILIPVNYARNEVDVKNISATIIVKGKTNISNEQMKDELTAIMRSVRKLPPRADDNFAINETNIISKGFDELFAVIAMVGWIIGGFSLLVGGFGIANIMFVSVKERTTQIGIQKSLGAKNYFILLQFLFEAIFLSMMGGVVGLVIVYLLTFIVSSMFDFALILTIGNVFLGLFVSALIGLVSGFIPAWSASRLNPVEAIRSSF
ncbi:MAG: ABC transporter permease [Bacteroidetes bacterium]|nr:MAG: ABC transporter permease [Bacteroidota bacterium]